MTYKVVIHAYIDKGLTAPKHEVKAVYGEQIEFLEGGGLRVVFDTAGGGSSIVYGPSTWYSVTEE